jgi:predicted metal-dependent hydrolase
MKIPKLAFFSSAERVDSISMEGFSVTVTRKNVKNLRLRVRLADGEVTATAPLRMSLDTVRTFVASKSDWLARQRSKFLAMERDSAMEYASGEIHYFLGIPYRLEVVEQNSPPEVMISDESSLRLSVRPGTSAKGREAVLRAWYAWRLAPLLAPEIARLETVMRVRVADMRFRAMKTRWGTCNVVTKRIWLNTELAKQPMKSILYVLVHEMVHLLERGHNEKFRRHMDEFFPDWKRQKAILNGSSGEDSEPDVPE